jgi:hypothetical protein
MQLSTLINKEELIGMKFSKKEVLNDEYLKAQRLEKANKAARLGNGYRGKVTITFMHDFGEVYKVETTVWACCENFLILKGGIAIPINSILEIDI